MTLTEAIIKRIISRLLKGQDHQIEHAALCSAMFLENEADVIRKVAKAKLRKQSVNADWHKESFLDLKSSSANQANLNRSTIKDGLRLERQVTINPSIIEHYELLCNALCRLIEHDNDPDLTVTVKLSDVSVELSLSESLIVINTLAVKRAELRGGAWSTAGKQVEKSLMLTLCRLFQVPESHYELTGLTDAQREVDFFLIDRHHNRYRCEVKLMGKGNPESADAIFARESHVFVADKLSELNKQQADKLKVKWVELRSPDGCQKFKSILDTLNIPNADSGGEINERLERIFTDIFK